MEDLTAVSNVILNREDESNVVYRLSKSWRLIKSQGGSFSTSGSMFRTESNATGNEVASGCLGTFRDLPPGFSFSGPSADLMRLVM